MEGEMLDEVEALYDEALGLKGMIEETKAKARLLLARVRSWRKAPETQEESIESLTQKIWHFHSDLRTYKRRLEEISQTLEDRYGPDFVF